MISTLFQVMYKFCIYFSMIHKFRDYYNYLQREKGYC